MIIRNVCALLLMTLACSAIAEETRWFEAEVLLFAQKSDAAVKEDFSVEMPDIKATRKRDLLTKGYTERGREKCLLGDTRFIKPDLARMLFAPPSSPVCDDDIDYLALMGDAPLAPFAESRDDMDAPYLLSDEQLQFSDKIRALKRKGLTPILHTGWRFPGEAKKQAPAYHLYGGKQLNTVLDPRFPPEPLVLALTDRLTLPPMQLPLWQLDGYLRIYLNHYLYIDADFDINSERDGELPERARFSQFRRVISGEIHYFDHPRIGMLVQIRRFKH